jgi:hypothetical protein
LTQRRGPSVAVGMAWWGIPVVKGRASCFLQAQIGCWGRPRAGGRYAALEAACGLEGIEWLGGYPVAGASVVRLTLLYIWRVWPRCS